ncbi:platelet endothelial cell adhesion molecule isoform X2 [Megalops cyprinoides]|uniref:platelet endothelial cell adhesion molecule isoform X2 n=1 Tax=Megalops cyprinoides TaxID=118141 RepID=UPI001864F08D|nr:platelet endothelial cell adhesion molecule isoform X2 [Megalops cyprinoides]
MPVTSATRAMREIQQRPVRMGRQPLCLLLATLFSTWQVAETQAVFTLNSVKLTVLPGNNVESGTNVTLRCVASVSHSTYFPLTYKYTFYKGKQVVYAKNVTMTDEMDYPIKEARVADSEIYKCHLKIQNKEGDSNTETLKVTGLQTPVLMVGRTEVTEGEKVNATCSAPRESGSFIFYFFEKNNTEAERVVTTKNTAQVAITLKPAGKTSLTCQYIIMLTPTNVQSNRSNELQVTVRELPISPSMVIRPNRSIIEGDVLNITCSVNMAPRHPSELTVHLIKGSSVLKFGNNNINYVKAVLAEDSGLYACKSEMGNVQKSFNDTVTVAELFSKPVLRMDPREVFENDRFSLECNSEMVNSQRIHRNDVRYYIYKDGELITPGSFDGRYSNTANTSLNGNYSCKAQAKWIPKSSTAIVFKAKLLVSRPVIRAIGDVILRRPFRIHCYCEKGSLPISYTLMKNKEKVNISTVSQPGDQAIFTAMIHKKEEIWHYTCDAQNKGPPGLESAPLNTHVIEPASRPILAVVPSPEEIVEGTHLALICKIEKGTHPITFTWYRRGKPVFKKVINQSELYASYDVMAVRKDHADIYHCEADNRAKQAVRSKDVTIEVKMAMWKKIAIGISVPAFLVLIALIIFYRRGVLRRVGVEAGGRSVWSERTSESDTDEQSSEESPKEPDVEYTEVVHPQPADSLRAPLRKGTDTVYSELQNSQGVADHAGYGSVEYVQLNHDLPEPV